MGARPSRSRCHCRHRACGVRWQASSTLRRSAEIAAMRWPGRGARRLVIALALIVAAVVYRPDRAIEVALGTTAHDLCSETFVSGQDPDETFRESLAPRPGYRWIARGIRYSVDREHREAT